MSKAAKIPRMKESEKPWAETERRWNALGECEQELVLRANKALAEPLAAGVSRLKPENRARSEALFEAVGLLQKAMSADE